MMDSGTDGRVTESTLARDEWRTYLLGVRSDAISMVRRTERALAELGHPVEPAVLTRRERRAEQGNGRDEG